jgi:phenylacetate-CoA ligase
LTLEYQGCIRYELSDAVVLDDAPDPSGRPCGRITRIDGRSDDVLVLPAAAGGDVAVHPYRLRAPFVRLLDVLQYQVVQRADGLVVRVVVRTAAPRDLAETVQRAVESAFRLAGARLPSASRSSTRSRASRVTRRRRSSSSRRSVVPRRGESSRS